MFKKDTLETGLLTVFIVFAFALTTWSDQAQAQEKYPTRAIEIISPYSPGGTNDFTARTTADFLKKKWKVPVNVLNKPGGNTIPANIELYNAKPDGYTVLCDQRESSIMPEITEKDLPYKVFDRTWLGVIHLSAMMFILPPNSPYSSLDDVIADIKKDPENFTWGSYGGSGAADSVFRSLFKAIGVDVNRTKPVVCGGGSKCTALTAGGNVKIGAVGMGVSAMGAIDSGIIKPLAMVGSRYAGYPKLVSTEDLGYPQVGWQGWTGFSGPPNVPSYIVDIWGKALLEFSKDPTVKSRFENAKNVVTFKSALEMKEQAMRQLKEAAELFPSKK
jgi:tripartite-type tricarboxylate transporter receptor subunit TctC